MSRPRRRLDPRVGLVAAGAVFVAIGISGCGSRTSVSGRAVFASDCAVCHSISGTSTPDRQGGDLRHLHLPRRQLVQYAAEMPVLNRPLTHAQLRAVVDYLQSRERRR